MNKYFLIQPTRCCLLFLLFICGSLSAQVRTAVPNIGPTIGGTSIDVALANTGEKNSTDFILVNGISVTFTNPSGNTVRFTTPAGTGLAVTIEGRKTSVTGTVQWTAAYTYDAPSTLSTMSPNFGLINVATNVTVTGTNFGVSGRVTSVTVGGTPATGISNTQTTVSFSTPVPKPAGAVTVVITVAPTSPATGNQILNLNPFTYQVALATELVNFSIEKQNKANFLSWKTADEKDLNNFVVERSANGQNYTALSEIKASGYQDNEYTYTDNTPLSINYYRLRLLEKDGQSSYSKVITATSSDVSNGLKIYPNPVGADGYLNIDADNTLESVTITNALGQVVLKTALTRIDVSQLPRGLYHISAQTNGELVTQKFLKN